MKPAPVHRIKIMTEQNDIGQFRNSSPREIRQACRAKEFDLPTCGCAAGYAQANVVILPKEYAFDFLLFCQRNPKACPLLEVLEAGCPLPDDSMAKDCDIRSDLPRYRVFENGQCVEEVQDISSLWRSDLVTFLIGCSFSFEEALISNSIPMRHIDEGRNVPMYNTSLECRSAGIFSGNVVVSMRSLSPADAIKATTITARYPRVHGSPVHLGVPEQIGVMDLQHPDYGESEGCVLRPGEVPVFWACGVTPQAVIMASRPSFCITHAPGYMLVMDTKNEDLANS